MTEESRSDSQLSSNPEDQLNSQNPLIAISEDLRSVKENADKINNQLAMLIRMQQDQVRMMKELLVRRSPT